ncbi:MAG: hypothetical protein HY819_02635 [Acidobacteria bacterium]|nr:hypothetical protein [Acidobacteriota bacterium]
MKRIKIIGCFFSLFLTTNLALAFGGVAFWEVSKQIDIERGDAQGVSVSDKGLISLSPTFKEVFNTEQPFVFSTVADDSGNIYLGTGHDGKVYKVDKNAKGSVFFDSAELDITALALDKAGNLYVGSSPDGKVYKITPDGKSSDFFDPEDKYIWSLAFDKTGDLFVGSGDKGVVYKVDSSGKGNVFIKTNEKHIISLAQNKEGNIIAGTDPGGLVLELKPSGKAFALFDSPLREIHQLAVSPNGTIYALAVSGQSGDKSATTSTNTAGSSGEAIATVTVAASFEDDVTLATTSNSTTSFVTTSQASTSDTTNSKAVLYQITPDGGNDVLWTTKDATALGLTLRKDGVVLVGTTQKGRIYAIEPEGKNTTLLVQSSEEQTTSLINTPNGIYAASSNNGKLFRLGLETVKEGFYTSPVQDTKLTATWGRIAWRSSGNVELQTRTGNTETPDATWSDWSGVYQSSENSKQITSPAARFIQWKAKLLSGSSLNSVKVAYLPRNVAPEVTKVTILQPGVGLQDIPQQPIDPGIISAGLDPIGFGLPTNIQPRKVFQKGARSLQWQAEDRNSDTLIYSIYYRTTLETDWHLLIGDLKSSYYTVDADSLPDGKYSFRIIASDLPSNSADRALKGELASDIIDIDNTAPQISASQPRINGRQIEISFSVTDNVSILRRAEYSIDGGAWQVVFPEDGLADSRTETFVVKTEISHPGEHVISLRCYDESANAGNNKVAFKTAK